MSFHATSIWPYFVVMLLVFGLAAIIARMVPFYRELSREKPPKFPALDGLRGYLAMSVFFCHAADNRGLAFDGRWAAHSKFYGFCGTGGVAFFFMITALLFWDKALATEGKLDNIALFRSRIRRVVPMYAFSVLCVVLIVFGLADFTLRTSFADLVRALVDWAAFGARGFPDINGVRGTKLIASGVFWSLTYEWAFYLALPALAFFWRPLPFAALLALAWVYLVDAARYEHVLWFMMGMAAAMLHRRWDLRRQVQHPAVSVVALASLVGAAVWFYPRPWVAKGLMFAFFVLVTYGNTLWGLLTTASSRVLGAMSYSLYVMHGFTLFFARQLAWSKDMSALTYWTWVALCACAAVIVSALTFRFVEHRFMHAKASSRRLRQAESTGGVPERQAA